MPGFVLLTIGAMRVVSFRVKCARRVMRILRSFKHVNRSISVVRRQIINLALTVLSIIFMSAGIYHLVEQSFFFEQMDYERVDATTCYEYNQQLAGGDGDGDTVGLVHQVEFGSDGVAGQEMYKGCILGAFELTFGDALYFLVVTISTVGYGEMYPLTWAGKTVVACMIVCAITVIPIQVNKLSMVLSMQSQYRTTYKPGDVPHVLVVGHVSKAGVLREFFTEFLHPDRFDQSRIVEDRHVVICAPYDPSEELRSLLMHPRLEGHIVYIKASVMNQMDLYRVGADRAEACFVLCDKSGRTDPDAEDSLTVMRSLVLETFNPGMKTFVQLLNPRNKEHIVQADVDFILCVDELKMHILAASAVSIGTSTLVNNLFRSFSSPAHVEQMAPWLREYCHGCSYEARFLC